LLKRASKYPLAIGGSAVLNGQGKAQFKRVATQNNWRAPD
jgi:hypothetical protein